VDVAHGLHPAHEEKSDPAVRPVLGGGVVIKQAASQAYAGDAEAVAIVRELARLHAIPVQDFVNRSDSRGGSTLGSIASALVPVRTMDVGVPILAMHSARETMAAADEAALISLVRAVLA
jgi:aspartyl aminopeptidase